MTLLLDPESDGRAGSGVYEPDPPLGPRLQFARAVIVMVSVFSVALLLHLFVVGPLQHRSAQHRLRDDLRERLANGTAPIGPTDRGGAELEPGTAVAVLDIPAIDLHEVVVEGTSASELYDGPGHRRDTPLPGQAGTSVIMGRRSTFGAPFRQLDALGYGDELTISTGQGTFTFFVLGTRTAGDPLPPPLEPTWARVTFETAGGSRFVPSGVVRVDADLVGYSVGGDARLIASDRLPAEERAMGSDLRTLWALALWLQGLLVLSVGAIWAWHRWGRAQAWIVFVPPLVFVGIGASGELFHLLPNLF